MSYRKPVPKFIPSPPPSPASSPSSTFRQLSLSLESAVDKDVPPLPADWRDAIDRAVSGERKTSSPLPSINTVVNYPGEDALENDIILDRGGSSPTATELETSEGVACAPPSPSETCCDSDGPVSRPGSPMPWTHSRRATGKRRTQAEYRPPTPPLPGPRNRSRSPESGSTSPVPTIISQLAPPEPPFLVAPHDSQQSPTSSYTRVEQRSGASHHSHSHSQQSSFSFSTPPASSSTHEFPNLIYQPNSAEFASREYASTLASTCTPAHTRPPSTLNFEKCHDLSIPPMHVVAIKHEKQEHPPVHSPQPRPSPTFRETLSRWRRSFSRKMKRFGAALGAVFCAPSL
ncbi:hypothetical protein BV22DRAFT_1133286 [Leucogyrophana mollusca]|uniref:Uncharacterized protein n=1 Tax=Leucogyrophana mollusca TaxID=85980 RepID=A0ACB8B3P5_9AGAM|nr:hypothetical protein BV22DRAFT_1133286 [Leucogyrophana mollusca]